MLSCISAIELSQDPNISEIEASSIRETVPHLEENAWMLLSIIAKVRIVRNFGTSITNE